MVQRFFLLLVAVIVLPDIYIYGTYISRPDINVLIPILYFLPGLLLLTGLIYFAYFASDYSVKGRWGGWFTIAFLVGAMPKLIFTLCSFVGLFFNHFFGWSQTIFDVIGIILALYNAGTILYGAFWGKNRFVIKNVIYSSHRLPTGFDGYRITLLSDLHVGSWKGNTKPLEKLVRMVNSQNPDLIVFTGDLVNHRAVELNPCQSVLCELRARDGIYSVLGNHDFGPYFPWEHADHRSKNLDDLKKRQADMGWILLNNDHVKLHNGNDTIALVGVENDGEPPFSQYADLPKAIEGTEGLFKILLSHNPTHWRREVLPDTDIDLMLAGHTHALQFECAGRSFSSRFYKEWSGMYYEGTRGLYVNIGAGHVGLPFRFGAWPEITMITLKSQK